jgi:hypothetical protein
MDELKRELGLFEVVAASYDMKNATSAYRHADERPHFAITPVIEASPSTSSHCTSEEAFFEETNE